MATTGLNYLKGHELWLKQNDGTWLILDANSIGTSVAIRGCVLISSWNSRFATSIGNFTTNSGSTLQDTENTIMSIIANYATLLNLNTEVLALEATIAGTCVLAAAFHTFWETSALTFGKSKESSGDFRIDSGSGDIYLKRNGVVQIRTQSTGVKIARNLVCSKNITCDQDVAITGSLTASTKAFLIDHPGDSSKMIAHSCWEGPTPGTMYKYHKVDCIHGSNFIDLPDYFNLINKDAMVFSNPVGHFRMSYGSVDENVLTLVTSKAGKYNVLVCADRSDPAVKNWTVIRNKPEVQSSESDDG